MATRPGGLCDEPGCGARSAPGHTLCGAHASDARERRAERIAQGEAARAGTATRRLYWSKAWKVLRLAQLARHPLCERCKDLGQITAGAEVDHIKRHRGDRRLFFARDNLQTLCSSCHSKKTAAERAAAGAWSRARGGADAGTGAG